MKFVLVFGTPISLAASAAQAATVSLPPAQNPSFQAIAANDQPSFNIWTGVAQSVTAVDTNVTFGFYLTALQPSQVLYSLYAGDGVFSSSLKQVIVNVPAANSSAALFSADFSDITLAVGSMYTFRASLLSEGLPLPGTYAPVEGTYAGSNNPYSGGRFWFSGAPYDQSSPAFANRDLAFEMVGTAAPVPEVESWALMIAGLGLAGAALRRRQSYGEVRA